MNPPQGSLSPEQTRMVQAQLYRVMGHPVRLQILQLLTEKGGSMPSADLLSATGISKPALSQHLTKMTNVGLVRTRRVGRFLEVELPNLEIGRACGAVGCLLSRGTAVHIPPVSSSDDAA